MGKAANHESVSLIFATNSRVKDSQAVIFSYKMYNKLWF